MLQTNNSKLPKGVQNLLIITSVAFVIQYIVPVIGSVIWDYGALVPLLVFKELQVWRLVTYMLLHGDVWHLAFNMLALWMFGVEIEDRWGTKRFLIFYLIAGVGSGFLSFIMWENIIIGASGAVLGLLTVYAYYYPNRKVLMFFIFPVPCRVAVAIIGAISILLAKEGDGVAHLTHLGGIIVALIYLRYYDKVISWNTHRGAVKAEKTMRKRAETKIQKDQYYQEVVDPILKKISEQGMDSLTKEERRKLEKISKNKKGNTL